VTLLLATNMSATEEINPYELLNVKQESTEQEIKTAYRQRSLKVHPDRVCLPLLSYDPIHRSKV
jgi:preprotein translocase subunit Sec63